MPTLTPVMKKFILHWGEMGTRWGINRTVAQIHALLYVSERPLNAAEIATTLSVARSNVSNSLHELQTWGIVRVVHVLGDRRDHFESMSDVWEMFLLIMDERKRREVDPTVALLAECAAEGAKGSHFGKRVGALKEFVDISVKWYDDVTALPHGSIRRLMKAGAKLKRLIGG